MSKHVARRSKVQARAVTKQSARMSAATSRGNSDPDLQWHRAHQALDLFNLDVMDRVEIVKRGIPATYVETLSRSMAMPKETFYRTIGLARATIDRKVRHRQRLSADESERVIGLARLVGQAQQMVQESGGDHEFDAPKWLTSWLSRQLGAIGGKRPGELMDTADGRLLVSDLLAQQQSGAYA